MTPKHKNGTIESVKICERGAIMGEMIEQLKSVISDDVILYGSICIVVLILLTIVILIVKQKKVKNDLAQLENKYNVLKGIPLAFKLNKAVALSRVNDEMSHVVESCKNDFDQVQEMLKECSVLLAEAEDFVYIRKIKAARRKMELLSNDLELCEQSAKKVDNILEEVIEQENSQREQINQLKEEFRDVKKEILKNRGRFNQGIEFIDQQIVEIEKMFSVFEEWMFASEFNKAADEKEKILENLKKVEELIEKLPALYERAKGILPRAIDELGYTYVEVKNKGIYLDHLEFKKNLNVLSDMLNEDLNKLKYGQITGIEESLDEISKRLVQLQDQLSKEDKAYVEINTNVEPLFSAIKALNIDIEQVEVTYDRVCKRFGFENWNEKLTDARTKLANLNEMQRKMEKLLLEREIPLTTILISFRELEQCKHVFSDEVLQMKTKLQQACSDEERAQKQLLKLQLIVNEIRVKILKHRLPSVSHKYEEDLTRASFMVKDIKCILDNSPLDVNEMNKQLRDAIDFTYTLYNSVNNLVGMAIMVENTIVFGNRYRSTHSEVDSELTRAELCFRNGEYTKALKIGIQAIEKIHPGAYEKLIKKQEANGIG